MTIAEANQLALGHLQAHRLAEAEAVARQVLAADKNNPDALVILGGVAVKADRFEEAIALLNRGGGCPPGLGVLRLRSLAVAHRQLLHLTESVALCERALALAPDDAETHLQMALGLLMLGDYPRGFAEFEWRWKSALLNTQRLKFTKPLWDGSDPAGKTILLYAEQGMGDVIMLARYAAGLRDRGAKVILGCQPPLERLMQTASGLSAATSKIDQTPAFDMQLPMFGLPRACGTTLQTIPQNVPYLFPNGQIAESWRAKLAGDSARLKVGLIWAGTNVDPNRALPAAALAPLASVPHVSFYSLQKGPRAGDLLPAGLSPRPCQLDDFADSAGLMQNLDLVLTVDTAGAHLAGALGRPVWTFVPLVPYWAWMLDRPDSPWYPTMRLFRQQQRGDWPSVVARAADELAALARA